MFSVVQSIKDFTDIVNGTLGVVRVVDARSRNGREAHGPCVARCRTDVWLRPRRTLESAAAPVACARRAPAHPNNHVPDSYGSMPFCEVLRREMKFIKT